MCSTAGRASPASRSSKGWGRPKCCTFISATGRRRKNSALPVFGYPAMKLRSGTRTAGRLATTRKASFECAVFAAELPDRRMTLKAVVVMNDRAFDATDATKMLQDFVKARLLPYKYPREVRFVDELPKTGTGKIDRQALLRI